MYRNLLTIFLVNALTGQSLVMAQDSVTRRSWLEFDGVKMAVATGNSVAPGAGGAGRLLHRHNL